MKNLVSLLLSFALVYGCGQSENSNSGDRLNKSPQIEDLDSNSPQDTRRLQARQVLQTLCVSCHSTWSGYSSDLEWQNSGLVVATNPDNSKLIYRLINKGSDMPQGGSALPNVEYQRLNDWILNMSDDSLSSSLQ